MLYRAENFPFVALLESNWRGIQAEYDRIQEHTVNWHSDNNGGWRVFGLFGFPEGTPEPDHIAMCPFTSQLIAAHVPSHGAGGFSVLEPHTHITPHAGHPGRVLRCHLGLHVPAGDCAIRIGTEKSGWAEGKCLVFDDRVEHEAWNFTDGTRAVLLVDFIP